ncbi:hypothetical protein CEXT_145771 [Caerostris extrusa]|uniref:Uncharacterized protein n=1 Tax=Caerostris extrusa TaxID=172846 RepID=A0AAV4WAD9_CAEEX|nr:hypothetical protein CEXT_145771 [Caerostris extrusa]
MGLSQSSVGIGEHLIIGSRLRQRIDPVGNQFVVLKKTDHVHTNPNEYFVSVVSSGLLFFLFNELRGWVNSPLANDHVY